MPNSPRRDIQTTPPRIILHGAVTPRKNCYSKPATGTATEKGDSGHPLWNLRFTIDPHQVQPGANTLNVDVFTVLANLSQGHPDSPALKNSWVSSGELKLENFTMDDGGNVSGTFQLNARTFAED